MTLQNSATHANQRTYLALSMTSGYQTYVDDKLGFPEDEIRVG
jgi:hypothetical protein